MDKFVELHSITDGSPHTINLSRVEEFTPDDCGTNIYFATVSNIGYVNFKAVESYSDVKCRVASATGGLPMKRLEDVSMLNCATQTVFDDGVANASSWSIFRNPLYDRWRYKSASNNLFLIRDVNSSIVSVIYEATPEKALDKMLRNQVING